jgi:uncharacterized membrane protein
MMKDRNRGQVLVLVALALFVILGMAALAVDVGFMFCTRNELQRSADAGALAGASAFVDTSVAAPDKRVRAEQWARDYASMDPVAAAPLNRVSEVSVVVSPPPDNIVRVDVSRNVEFFFAGVLGMQNRTITARAVASTVSTDNSVRLTE